MRMVEEGKRYNGRLVIRNESGLVKYREGDLERECALTTFTQRHGETPDNKEDEKQ